MMLEWVLITNLACLGLMGAAWAYSEYKFQKKQAEIEEKFEKKAMKMLTNKKNLTKIAKTIGKVIMGHFAGKMSGVTRNSKLVGKTIIDDLQKTGKLDELAKHLPQLAGMIKKDEKGDKLMGLMQWIPQIKQMLDMLRQPKAEQIQVQDDPYKEWR